MNKIYKAVLAAAMIATTATTIFVAPSVNAGGDSANGRPMYSIDDINAGKLGDTITFNSIVKSGIGDESNFVGARVATNLSGNWSQDSISVKDGETYTIRLYVHNNSPKGTEAIAEGVSAYFNIPTGAAKSHTIVGHLNSTNATPKSYWDEVTLTSNDEFIIEYIPGSAAYTNSVLGTVALPDTAVTSGATLGYDKLDGKIPGCFKYEGTMTIQVKVHKAVASKLDKKVRIKGTKDWSESVTAKIGDEVEYRIEYKNLLSSTVSNVVIRDFLPQNMVYVQNTTSIYNGNYPNGAKVDQNTVTTTGINIGDYTAGSNAIIVFTAKVKDQSLKCGENTLINWANSTVNSNEVSRDDATVKVTKSGKVCETPTPTPTPEPEPTPTPTPDPDPTPVVIVQTGAGTIVTGAIGAGAMVTTLGYYVASRKKLMK